jgi:3-oxoacyl-[acyl-carrier-protein] synthase-3
MSLKRSKIISTGRALPEKVLTNFDLEKIVDTNDEWIVKRTGIKSRHIADQNTATSDLAIEASKKAMEKAGITAEEIDLIMVATVTPDMIFPSTACIVQEALGAVNAAAFDLETATSGFLYGLTIEDQFINTGMYKKILVIGAETLSKVLDWEDRKTCILFGDGAGAAIVGVSDDESEILSTHLGADGSGADFLAIPAGGSRMPATADTVAKRLHYITMDGSEVFKFAVRKMSSASLLALELAGLDVEDVDFLVPHQANIRIINSAAKKLKLPIDKVHVNLDRLGNISAGSIPIALDEAIEEGKINKGDVVVLVGFGGGLTWGSCVIRL